MGYDVGADTHRLELVLGERISEIGLVQGDITDLSALERALDHNGITRVIHLAALQVPSCRANPSLGARVNVLGTANVFEAVRRRSDRIPGLVYASSAAVYGPRDRGAEDERTAPATHYGVYKVANEGTARIYWDEHSLPSIGFRPYTVYGPGRDQGMTSTPTQAMLAAARGEPFHITFGGTTQYHYAPDVARCIVAACEQLTGGACVHNLPGPGTDMPQLVAAIAAAVPEAAPGITFAPDPLPFPPVLESSGSIPYEATPLHQGVAETIAHFREYARRVGTPLETRRTVSIRD